MHQSAMFYGKKFFELYCARKDLTSFVIVEIGSQDVNGSLREVAPPNVSYIGLDFVEGKGVDFVIEDPYKIPLPNESADIVVTSSCFEHSEFFWLTFLEVARILKPGGFIYLNVPSNGIYHRYPVDCWRFYPDSGSALASWARRSGFDIHLIESFIGDRSDENIWNDFVAVFNKANNKGANEAHDNLIIKNIDNFSNAISSSGVVNFSEQSSDLKSIASLTLEITKKDQQIAKLQTRLSESESKYIAIRSSTSWRLTAPFRALSRMMRS